MNATVPTVICALDELAERDAREFTVGAGDWPLRGFVVRYHGAIRAYENRCPHAGHALNWLPNRFFAPQSDLLICSSHGALFDADSGDCVAGPCMGRALRALDVAVENGNVVLRSMP